jgi:hypothetical protein
MNLEARARIEAAHKGFADLLVEEQEPSIYAGPALEVLSFCPLFVRPPVSDITIPADAGYPLDSPAYNQ